MAYIINRYDGTILTSVEDSTINQITEVKFVGKNFAGYGETHNENFLYLMENFASAVAPGKPLSGMIWYDNSSQKIKFYDGTRWRTAGSAEVNVTQPDGSTEGDLWWNANTGQLFARSSSNEWILVGPQTTSLGTTLLRSREVVGTDTQTYAVIEAVISDSDGNANIVFLISDSDFTIDDTIDGNSIDGFTDLKKGISLAQTNFNGVSSDGSPNDTILWGTASDSLKLGGLPASSYIRSDNPIFNDDGITIGDDGVIKIYVTNNNESVIENLIGDTIIFKINDETIFQITETSLVPGEDNTFDIGTTEKKWRTLYAYELEGNAASATQLRVGTNDFRNASELPVANTIAARTKDAYTETTGQLIPAGSLRAQFFVGRATTAQYADLAEKYTTDQEYPVGTAIMVARSGDAETTAASKEFMSIGVISEYPAYLMNAESSGQAVALKGRVPVRVTGAIRKGQPVYAWENGVCSRIETNSLVGIALESSDDDGEKLIECVLKV